MTTVATKTFGAHSTTDEVLEGVDLRGKVALITGANTGIGLETARALASKGARVIITARDGEKGQTAVAKIKTTAGEGCGPLEYEVLELSSLASVRECVERLLKKGVEIDYLIANAGVGGPPVSKTEDGFETHLGVNHLAHFVFVNKLVPLVKRGGRIVVVSSLAMRFSPVLFDDIQLEKSSYDSFVAYGQSKTANVLYAIALNKRLAARGIEVFSLHPGAIKTDLQRHITPEDAKKVEGMKMEWKSIPQGASTTVYAATAPELSGKGGAFLGDCTVWGVDDGPDPLANAVKSYAIDPALAEKLWAVSEEMVGEKFEF